MIVAHVVRGFDVTGFGAALIAAPVVGLVNATIGMFPKSQTEAGKATPEQLNITLNWFEELKQRVPIK